jgi:hypothetical protein
VRAIRLAELNDDEMAEITAETVRLMNARRGQPPTRCTGAASAPSLLPNHKSLFRRLGKRLMSGTLLARLLHSLEVVRRVDQGDMGEGLRKIA